MRHNHSSVVPGGTEDAQSASEPHVSHTLSHDRRSEFRVIKKRLRRLDGWIRVETISHVIPRLKKMNRPHYLRGFFFTVEMELIAWRNKLPGEDQSLRRAIAATEKIRRLSSEKPPANPDSCADVVKNFIRKILFFFSFSFWRSVDAAFRPTTASVRYVQTKAADKTTV